MKISNKCIVAFCIGIIFFMPIKSFSQEKFALNSNKTIDSVYSINQLNNLIIVND